MIYYDTWISPLGEILLRANQQALTGVFFDQQKYFPEATTGWQRAPCHAPLEQAREQLTQFFDGTRREFSVPLEPAGSVFQQQVWQVLAQIPYGTIVSYGEIARRVGVGREHARAVGSATGRNPISIMVPCHRVLSSTRQLTGYAGGLDRKRALLALEGARAASTRNLELALQD